MKMDEATEAIQDEQQLTLADYKSSPFEVARFQVVGKQGNSKTFEPLQIEIAKQNTLHDSMFRDYGHIIDEGTVSVTHGGKSIKVKKPQEESKPGKGRGISEDELLKIREEAYASAKEEVEREARKELENVKTQCAELIESIYAEHSRALEDIEREAINVALLIARKIIGQAVEINPEYILPVLKSALDLVDEKRIKKILVSPQDYEFLQMMNIEKKLQNGEVVWKFESDPNIKDGCIIDMGFQKVDLRLEEAWNRLADKIISVTKG